MRLDEVRRWAAGRGVDAQAFRSIYEGALLHTISRLLQAIYRESRAARLTNDPRGRWCLDIGVAPLVRVPVSGPLPFRRLETIGFPRVIGPAPPRQLRTTAAFLRALTAALDKSEYGSVLPALCSDFENSVVNVVLNRIIGRSLNGSARALEPAYQGHQYYPFPALRIGPELPQILECSHLNSTPIDLPLLEVDAYRFKCATFSSPERCTRAWSGLPIASGVLLMPVHPWQLQLSPVLREMIARRLTRVSPVTVKAIPLASQRTIRIERTGFDVKLPIDATLTGEHRLLYPLNCENAPVISVLAKRVRALARISSIDFQQDVASMFHPQAAIAPHLSAIVRAPVRSRHGETVVPAIELWAGRERASALLRGKSTSSIEDFFARYCWVLMDGPVRFCAEWGIAFEPHVQNVYIVLRNGRPVRIVLRDLDASVLHERRVRPMLRDLGLDVGRGTWRHMPPFEIGSKRMVQAMLFGHLGEVMWWLAQRTGVSSARLSAIVEDTWSDLAARATSASARAAVKKLQGWSDSVKATLHTRLHRSYTMQFVVKE